MNFQPRKSIADLVYESLRANIVEGKLPPGDKLVPREIAGRFGCSPMPIRDAITRLATEGFVTVSPRKVTRVADHSVEEMTEVFAIRAVLEAFAARLACRALTESDLRTLDEVADRMARCLTNNDLKTWNRANKEFHALVYRWSSNTTLRAILKHLWDKTLHRRDQAILARSPEFLAPRTAEHQAIVKAFRARNAAAVERLWREHIVRAGEDIRALFCAAQGAHSGRPSENLSRRLSLKRVRAGSSGP